MMMKIKDIIFAPTREEMYPQGYRTYVELQGIDQDTREGKARPGFFRGVATGNLFKSSSLISSSVCTKLFNIIQPTKVYFGQKDGVQCIAIKTIVNNLNMPIDVVICPTMREQDGLAMSSRNAYLNLEERKVGIILYQALKKAEEHFKKDRKTSSLINVASSVVSTKPEVKLDYLDICDLENGRCVEEVSENGAMLSGAIWVGKTRLIDNIILK